MKRFYTMLGTVLAGALAVNALPVKPGTMSGVPNRSVSTMLKAGNVSVNRAKSAKAKTFGKLPAAAAAALKAPSKAEGELNIITVAPEGKAVTMSGHSNSFYVDYGMVNNEVWDGLAYDGVQTDNGEFYLYNPISLIDTKSYIKGTVTETGLSFEFPQAVYSAENEEGNLVNLFVDVLEAKEVDDPDQGLVNTYVPAENTRTITFTKNEKGQYVMDGDYMMGLISNDIWQGYGEMEMVLTPFDQKPVELPAGLKYDYSYVLADELNGMDQTIYRPLGVARDGEDMYILGLFPELPNSLVKGTFDSANNVLTIPTGQFTGRYANYFIFMMAGDGYEYFDEDWEEEMIDLTVVDKPVVLYFDPEKNVFAPKNEESHYTHFIFNFGNVEISPCNYVCVSRIFSQGEVKDFAPVNPKIETVADISMDDPTCSYGIEFFIYGDNNEHQMLMDKNIYYNLYINDELYPLTAEEFPMMPIFSDKESMGDIPVAYSDDYDIIAAGPYHAIKFRNKDIRKIGVRTVYIDGETRAESEIVSCEVGSSVNDIEDASPVVNEEYFDVTGCRVAGHSEGSVVIKRVTREDGTVHTYKLVR